MMKFKHVSIGILLTLSFFSCKKEMKNDKVKTTVITSTTVGTKNKGLEGQSSVDDKESAPNALQTAKTVPDLSTLVAAIKAGGVENAVVNAGPLTIFAPLNSGFDKLPKGTVETLLKPENKEKLAFILKNHVAPANYPIKQLKKEAKKGRKLYMASGKYLVVENKNDKIFVDGIEILKTVQVSNGWVHVIDAVIVPKE